MKKIGILNAPVSTVIAHLEHNDMLTIGDAGLPVPSTTQRIDLALKPGVPGLLETLDVVLTEMYVERVFLSEDIKTVSPQFLEALRSHLPGIPFEFIPHMEFKKLTGQTKAVIRTAEFTPYSNVILVAGAWGFQL